MGVGVGEAAAAPIGIVVVPAPAGFTVGLVVGTNGVGVGRGVWPTTIVPWSIVNGLNCGSLGLPISAGYTVLATWERFPPKLVSGSCFGTPGNALGSQAITERSDTNMPARHNDKRSNTPGSSCFQDPYTQKKSQGSERSVRSPGEAAKSPRRVSRSASRARAKATTDTRPSPRRAFSSNG